MSATQKTQVTPATIAIAAVDEQRCGHELDEWADPAVAFREKPISRLRMNYERGMATAEYAIGVLAAIAVALTLAKFITGASFLDPFTKAITEYIGKLGSTIKVR